MSEPQQDVIITGFKNPTSEGIVIELNKPARLKTGTGHFKEFFISWDKIGKALIEGYTEKMEVNDLRELRKEEKP
jgi:outer membrane receptor for ferrienterochelin and colicin